jgi:hypothetical protein
VQRRFRGAEVLSWCRGAEVVQRLCRGGADEVQRYKGAEVVQKCCIGAEVVQRC